MKTELEILKDVQLSFRLQSDTSTMNHGYRVLCEKIAKLESESPRPVEDGNFKTEKEAIKWVLHNTPIMVKSVRKCRTKLVFPFRGKSAMNDVCECLGRELFKKQLEAEHMDVPEWKKEE